MNRNRRIFIVVFLAFTLLVVMLTVDMASRTTAPWNKKKQASRALPGNRVEDKTLLIDTTGLDSLGK
ncbi:hypothetical protein [Fibrivirga algicola]|uniref:Uncharacterized protein n=1 Tax=Fibrivirga algicola TaxID=2950420 RepID=A0ABX0QGU8_9BACT|nr:hypothetical protein [Fibrivirga algicola]ARK11897.1 hypothetical protein A6C57_17035 [Fibrella sp. ES10-3-2-2]NID11292.1 hypothetical protein [Fibrivirga algicola]